MVSVAMSSVFLRNIILINVCRLCVIMQSVAAPRFLLLACFPHYYFIPTNSDFFLYPLKCVSTVSVVISSILMLTVVMVSFCLVSVCHMSLC